MADEETENKPAAKKGGKKPAGKGKGKDAGKKKKGAKKGDASDGAVSVASNARAAAAVKRAKGWGGIVGFAVAAYLGYKANVPPDQLGLRALAAGVAGYMLAWICAVAVWRNILMAELKMKVETKRPPAGPRTISPHGDHAAAHEAAAVGAPPQPAEVTE